MEHVPLQVTTAVDMTAAEAADTPKTAHPTGTHACMLICFFVYGGANTQQHQQQQVSSQ
jgi:hypothetical protein